MLDRFVYGHARRISPEAPIPVLLSEREEIMLGGAGNVVRNLTALGAQVSFAAVTGDDSDADLVESLLGSLPACGICIARDAGRKTSVKTRYLAHSQQLLRVDAESTGPIGEDTLDDLLAHVRGALPNVDLAILSDYAKGVLSGSNASAFIGECRRAGKPVFVDPKGLDFSRYRGASLIKPNLKELGEAARMAVESEGAVEEAARRVIAETGIEAVLATRGAAGMMLVRAGSPPESFRSLAREIFDVSGAGDTVAATLAAGAASGLDLADAVHVACIAAGIVVGKVGTATVTAGELIRELETGGELRVLSEAEALKRAQVWRAAGSRVGFLSGSFHPLTAEEVQRVRAAKEQCDKLIVGIAAGAAQDEAVVLGSLAAVDLVVQLEGDAPEFATRLR